jgi:hypothetical protein
MWAGAAADDVAPMGANQMPPSGENPVILTVFPSNEEICAASAGSFAIDAYTPGIDWIVARSPIFSWYVPTSLGSGD